MGRSLADSHAPSAALLKTANQVLGYDLGDILFNGPEDKLKQTQFTQPALFTVSMMVFGALKEKGLRFDFAAGHSLGEYSALCAAGVFGFEDGLKLVKLRGELMGQAGERRPGAMAAVLGLEVEKLHDVLARAATSGVVVAANFNSLTQIVISGESAAVAKACEYATEAGAKKVVPLPVSGAFHSPLMDYAVDGLRLGLEQTAFRDAEFPILSNVEARPEKDAARLKELLLRQMVSPVRWVECIRQAMQSGCLEGLEVGAGKVLMGLARGISRDFKVTPVETPEDLEKIAG